MTSPASRQCEPVPPGEDERVWRWLSALERRHLATLTFAELRRALTALSALYVERRGARLGRGDALEGVGKRAAFGFFYGALHFAVVRAVVRGLGATGPRPTRIIDLGCGTGVAGAAWAIESGRRAEIVGVDRSGWALAEARWNWPHLGVSGTAMRRDILDVGDSLRAAGVMAAFAVNELADDARAQLLTVLLDAHSERSQVLIVEPLSRRVSPWWEGWKERFLGLGGRADEWRLAWRTTQTLALLDRAAGLDHREVGARSLWLG